MTRSQQKFIEYVRTRQIFGLRLKGDDVSIKPIHIGSSEIEKKFFTRYNRKDNIAELEAMGELRVTKTKLDNERKMFAYQALKSGTIDFSLLPAKPTPQDPVSRAMIEHLQNISLPAGAPSTEYFDVFLKYKTKRIDLFVTIDDFCGRFHTPFASFHRTHRPNVLLEGEPTGSLDVCTSQPLILGKILNDAIGRNDFSDWIQSGKDVYVMVMEMAKIDDRDVAKKLFLKMLFSPDLALIPRMFGSTKWGDWITEFKSRTDTGNPKPKVYKGKTSYHNNLAWLLQSTEVSIMRKIWENLVELRIPFLSVHDEIVVKRVDIDKAYEAMNKIMASEFQYYKISVDKGRTLNDDNTNERSVADNKEVLKTALNELVSKFPNDTSVVINGDEYPCFKTVVQMVLEGWLSNPSSKYFQDRIREIFHLMHLNGFTQFENKY